MCGLQCVASFAKTLVHEGGSNQPTDVESPAHQFLPANLGSKQLTLHQAMAHVRTNIRCHPHMPTQSEQSNMSTMGARAHHDPICDAIDASPENEAPRANLPGLSQKTPFVLIQFWNFVGG